jgi:thiamine-monophosphate kinase
MAESGRVSEIGEFGLIEKLEAVFGESAASDVRLGIGDDAALVSLGAEWDLVLTCDAMIENEHFLTRKTSLDLVGRKALATSLSDIAAMGGDPKYALLTLGCPAESEVEDILDIARGMRDLGARYGVTVVGGDTVRNRPGIIIAVTVVGFVRRGTALLRSGAKVGDAIFVTGTLGDSAIGLRLLTQRDSGARLDPDSLGYLKQRHLLPTPRVREGKMLSSTRVIATAAIDVSDGLLADLGHICERSGVGAVIEWKALPVSREADLASQATSIDLFAEVLGGGEDYELLFCSSPEDAEGIEKLFTDTSLAPVTRIGEIVEGSGVAVEGLPEGVERRLPRGFDHFAQP